MERETRKLIGRPEGQRTGIGAILTKHRKAKGWTQAQLAEAIGIDQRSYSHYERNERELSVTRIIQIANALGLEPMHLFAELVKEMQDAFREDAS